EAASLVGWLHGRKSLPVQASRFQFSSSDIEAKGEVREAVKIRLEPIENLVIAKPARCTVMDLTGRRGKLQYMAAILEFGHVSIERLPVVADDHYATRCLKLSRNTGTLKLP
ncbi:MAG: hypothetical protein KDD69_19895, partial [Bdellovibrionales bacterium]|nr:hypothetical protein [Bdellovibrionales bacterium]